MGHGCFPGVITKSFRSGWLLWKCWDTMSPVEICMTPWDVENFTTSSTVYMYRSTDLYMYAYTCTWTLGKKLHGGSGRFCTWNAKKSPWKSKKSPWKLPCRLQCKSLFNVADLVNIWDVKVLSHLSNSGTCFTNLWHNFSQYVGSVSLNTFLFMRKFKFRQ